MENKCLQYRSKLDCTWKNIFAQKLAKAKYIFMHKYVIPTTSSDAF